jgi:hypothetical protein
MVLDLAKFAPSTEPEAGFLTVLEEIPGKHVVKVHDNAS